VSKVNTWDLVVEAISREQIPALVGPPQRGKTMGCRLLASAKGWNYHVVNPQLFNPEEFGGLPHIPPGRRTGAHFSVEWTLPVEIPKELFDPASGEWLLHIDEMDKAVEDNLSILLSLLDFQRRIRTHRLDPARIHIVISMNEPKRGLPDALASRLVYLAYPSVEDMPDIYARKDLAPVKHILLDLHGAAPEIAFPERPSSPASLHLLVRWFDYVPFWEDDTVKARVVRGLFPHKEIPRVLGMLTDRPVSSVEAMVKWIEGATPATLIDRYIKVATDMSKATPEGPDRADVVKCALEALVGRTTNDPTKEWDRINRAFFTTKEIIQTMGLDEEKIAGGTALWKEKVSSSTPPTPEKPNKKEKKEE